MCGVACKIAFVLVLICVGPQSAVSDLNPDIEYAEWLDAESDLEFRGFQAKLLERSMNTSVDPCDDFYQFACGNWQSYAVPKEPGTGTNEFLVLKERLNFVYAKLLASEVDETDNEAEIKAKTIFKTCIDSELDHLHHFKSFLESFASWPALNGSWSELEFDWVNLTAHTLLFNVSVFFDVKYIHNEKDIDPETNVPFTYIYLAKAPHYARYGAMRSFREYFRYMRTILRNFDVHPRYMLNMARRLYEFDKRFVKILTKARDVLPLMEPVPFSKINRWIGKFNSSKFVSLLAGRYMSETEYVNIRPTHYSNDVLDLIRETSPRTIADYIFWRFVDHFFWIVKALQMDNASKEKLCTSIIKDKMSSALTSMFSKKYFTEELREDVRTLIRSVQNSGLDMISTSSWIDYPTKLSAAQKLRSLSSYIAYPSYILVDDDLNMEYDRLEIGFEENFIKNFARLSHFGMRKQYDHTGISFENQWLGDSFDPNAFFDNVTLIFTVALLQPPFFHPYSPNFANYGALGTTIGHEIMHGFDRWNIDEDHARQKIQWWSLSLEKLYFERMDCFVKQYNNYKIHSYNTTVDGTFTLSENLADTEGLNMAFLAYSRWLERTENAESLEKRGFENLDLTPKQLFFLSYSQTFCADNSERSLEKIETTYHAIEYYRVIGSLSNSKEFSETFHCPEGSNMNPIEKCSFVKR